MSPGRFRARPAHHDSPVIHPVSLLLLIFLSGTSHAQSTVGASVTTSGIIPTVSESTITPRTSLSPTESPKSMTTSFTTSSTSNSTISSAASTATRDITPQLFPGATQPDTHRVRNESVFNYYFLFLALFGALVVAFLWWIHRRRKRRKEQMRLSGQNALARDLDGWIHTRRWFHGAWRHNQTAAFVRREEGLNEHGEAPPPYQPKGDVTVAHEGAGAQDPANGLTIPLRTLSREEIEQSRPPEYRETINRGESSSIRPDTANTRTTRPETADLQPGSSTRDLLSHQSTR